MQKAIKKKKEMCKIQSEDNKNNYKRKRNQTRKIFSRAMRREPEQEMNDLCDKQNSVFKHVKCLKKGKTRCKWWMMFERNGRLAFSEKN